MFIYLNILLKSINCDIRPDSGGEGNMTNFSCGIDFGTTNSTIGVLLNNQPKMVQLETNSISMPTALFFEDKKKVPLYGKSAIEYYTNGADGRLIRSIKRILGSELMDKFTVINGKGVRFDELIGLFLYHLTYPVHNNSFILSKHQKRLKSLKN